MSLDKRTRDILDLLNHDPLHAHDRERILKAIKDEADRTLGIVDPNAVRRRLSDEHNNLVVNPKVLSGFYSRLARHGYLTPHGFVQNGSRGNGNKVSRKWRRVADVSGDAA